MHSKDELTYFNLARVHALNKQHDQAIEAIDRSIEYSTTESQAAYAKGYRARINSSFNKYDLVRAEIAELEKTYKDQEFFQEAKKAVEGIIAENIAKQSNGDK